MSLTHIDATWAILEMKSCFLGAVTLSIDMGASDWALPGASKSHPVCVRACVFAGEVNQVEYSVLGHMQ